MEFGLRPDLPIYSGGLGILAGDHLKAAADLKLPICGVSLAWNRGYLKQRIQHGGQVEEEQVYNPADFGMELVNESITDKISVKIQGRDVRFKAWKYDVVGRTGFKVPLFLLDTSDKNGDNWWDNNISSHLYLVEPNDRQYWRIVQEIVLGIGGLRLLQEMGYDPFIHMNEGHAAFAALERYQQLGNNLERTREGCIFTTHTPIAAGHDCFEWDEAGRAFGDYYDGIDIAALCGHDGLNTTRLALSLSRYANAVSKKHREVSQRMFPEHNIEYITNGVHTPTWTSERFQDLFDRFIPGWRMDNRKLVDPSKIPDADLLAARDYGKQELLSYVEQANAERFDPELLTVGFARRFAEYKRADLIFSEIQRLIDIGKKNLQIVFAGKAHPTDGWGKGVLAKVHRHIEHMRREGIHMVFLEDYDMRIGALLTRGVDVWLNMPRRPCEASGTSGMKVLPNGGVNFSVLDGWWPEANRRSGYVIGGPPKEIEQLTDEDEIRAVDRADAKSFYDRLRDEVIPDFRHQRKWIERMRVGISEASMFSAERMVRQYAEIYGLELPPNGKE